MCTMPALKPSRSYRGTAIGRTPGFVAASRTLTAVRGSLKMHSLRHLRQLVEDHNSLIVAMVIGQPSWVAGARESQERAVHLVSELLWGIRSRVGFNIRSI